MNPPEAIAAALIAAACDRVPALRDAFDQLTPDAKRATMLIICAIIAALATIAKCAQNECTRDNVIETAITVLGYALLAFLQIVAINQTIHKIAKTTTPGTTYTWK